MALPAARKACCCDETQSRSMQRTPSSAHGGLINSLVCYGAPLAAACAHAVSAIIAFDRGAEGRSQNTRAC